MSVTFTNEFDCADAIIARVGKQLRVATPLAAGKPVPILNALYRRAKEDTGIKLEIYTALTLAKSRGKSLLERRFLEPFAERVFGDYPDPEFHLDREQNALPPNVRVIEFYFPAGKQLDSRHSQENYVSANYTHVARDLLERRVYDHAILQRLLNEGAITEEVTAETVYHLLERRAISPQLSAKDFRFLKTFGILRDSVEYDDGYLILEDGTRIEADLNQEVCADRLFARCLGKRMANGAIVHGAFFLGPQVFYDWLNAMPKDKRRLIHMKSVTRINQLYGHEELDRLHRRDARFVNTAMMMTLLGGAVSDQLEDGRVVSGVGGQYNFVAMAHALPDGHALLQLRSTRNERGRVRSSIIFNYGHITIPRHLRDIAITEYGIADLRGKTDSEVAAALIEVADSRFQDALIREAQQAGKLRKDYKVPGHFRNNYPETIQAHMARLRSEGLFPPLPFGTDFTEEELVLGKALKSLKNKASSKRKILQLLLHSAGKSDGVLEPYLRRMGLETPKTLEERLYARLLKAELALSQIK